MTAHPDFEKLRASIARLLATAEPFLGTVYRSSEPGYANAGDLLTGAGSGVHGGRWNPPGSLRISEQRMTGDDWRKTNDDFGEESLTQAIGRAAFDAGLEAIVVRACDGGQNLVWFAKNLHPKSKDRGYRNSIQKNTGYQSSWRQNSRSG